VVLVVFIVMAGAGLVLPILPLFARSFGVGYGAVGLLVSAYGLARLVFDLAAVPTAVALALVLQTTPETLRPAEAT
jgi:predicted MFS family arabinose efflux permease